MGKERLHKEEHSINLGIAQKWGRPFFLPSKVDIDRGAVVGVGESECGGQEQTWCT